MYVYVRYKESDRSCVYVFDTRRVIGHVCMCQIQGWWSAMYVCVRCKRVIGHVFMC